MSIRALLSINDIDPQTWNALWSDYPFTQHAFLSALENTGCVDRQSGWQVQHLIYEENSLPVAALPLYLKYNSYGEYVFDWAWADAYQRNGLPYYPKLLSAIPFTPASGPRLGFAASLDEQKRQHIVNKLLEYCCSAELSANTSSMHILFPFAKDATYLQNAHPEDSGFTGDKRNSKKLLKRLGYQFHWFNNHYTSFDDFLATFNSRKRKNLKRERSRVNEANLQIIVEEGAQISSERWQSFYIFYHTTYLKRSGHYGYLTKEFFQQLATSLGDQVVLISALKKAKPVAMALFFHDQETLYGRYWGCEEDIDCLHFELCYYQGIEYAIKHKLKRFDPGAQGEHKIQRGFTPVYTCSLHHLHNPAFHQAVANFVQQENLHLNHYMQQARAALPFRDDIELVSEDVLLRT